MESAPLSPSRRSETAIVIILTVLLVIYAFTGGSARADQPSLLILRPATWVALVLIILVDRPADPALLKPLGLIFAAFSAAIGIQLIPLPPAWWGHLPGHARFLEAASAAAIPQPWQPISINPERTVNSLLALLPAAVLLFGMAKLSVASRGRLLAVALAIVGVSIVVGVAQIAGGSGSDAYLYPLTSRTLPVGLLANRNHQAVLMTMALPLAAGWLKIAPSDGSTWRPILATLLVAIAITLLMMTGSRTGVIVLVIVAVATAALLWPERPILLALGNVSYFLVVALALAAIVGLAFVAGRALSLERFSHFSEQEMRLRALPVIWQATRDFLPFGTGFGTFDSAFRIYEPDAMLKPTYFNQAHNDALELLMTGGIPAAIVAVAFLGWFATRIRILLGSSSSRSQIAVARVGAIIAVSLLAGSLTDYPLRTPLLTALFTLACCWAATTPAEPRSSSDDSTARSVA